jgi:hypothetical protein
LFCGVGWFVTDVCNKPTYAYNKPELREFMRRDESLEYRILERSSRLGLCVVFKEGAVCCHFICESAL